MSIFKKHPLAVSLSIAFHLLLVGFFVFGVNSGDNQVQSKPPVNIVKATTIDESKIKAEAEKLKNLEKRKKSQEKKRLNDIKKKRLAEEKKIANLKKQQDIHKKKLAKQKADEAAKQAKLKKQKMLAKKKKKLADAKKKKDRLAGDKAAKIKAAKIKAAKVKAAQEQANRERDLMARAEKEEQNNRDKTTISSFTDSIRLKVGNNWIEPLGSMSNLICTIKVRLIPGGEVIDVQVVKSSGNSFFDRSVEIATRKASPLPVSSDPRLFSKMREIEFTFDPSKK